MTEEASAGAEAVGALAAALSGRFGAAVTAGRDGDVPALVWTDGPPVDEVAEAARALAPETADGTAFRRELSERWIALGAIRLAPSPMSCGMPVPVSPAAAESLWWRTPLPVPLTPREESLVYALLYEVHDDHRRNHVTAEEIFTGLARRGLAALLLRSGAELTPAELLTARYAASHGHLAWRTSLRTMPVPVLLDAVHDDPHAPPECLAAARTLKSATENAS
ncbi:hypothetical protein [Streptomyces sp. NPDC058486]|uniref:hypothetical protein n=1 Tax=unclassified Streptomyces TaxID=2593676 RepID=UPI00365E9C6B